MAQLIRRSSALVAVAAVTVLVAGCASSSKVAGSPPSSSAVAPASFVPSPADPLALVGSWLLDAPGVASGTVLRLGDDLSLWSNCGYLDGSWAADHAGLFVGQLWGGDGSCMSSVPSQGPTPAWLAKVVAFRLDGTGAVLLDASGAVAATLRPGGHPTAGPNLLPSLADPPTVGDQLRASLAPTAPLPPGLAAARPSQLIGYWVSAANPNLRGDADLAADGSWQGTDGANDAGGRWSAAPDGELVVTAGPSTAMGCAPEACADVNDWFVQASRAAFDGSTLVLLDASGKETGRAVRGVDTTVGPTGSDASPPPTTIAVTSASALPYQVRFVNDTTTSVVIVGCPDCGTGHELNAGLTWLTAEAGGQTDITFTHGGSVTGCVHLVNGVLPDRPVPPSVIKISRYSPCADAAGLNSAP